MLHIQAYAQQTRCPKLCVGLNLDFLPDTKIVSFVILILAERAKPQKSVFRPEPRQVHLLPQNSDARTSNLYPLPTSCAADEGMEYLRCFCEMTSVNSGFLWLSSIDFVTCAACVFVATRGWATKLEQTNWARLVARGFGGARTTEEHSRTQGKKSND